MRLIPLLLCFALLCGCATRQPVVSQTAALVNETALPEVELKSIVDLRATEETANSERIQAETNYVSRYAIPLDQPEIYLREDPLLPEVPLVVRYFPAAADGKVRKVQYEWGGQEGKPYWVQQPLEKLEAFQERYEALRSQLTDAYGEPSESTVLNASRLGDVTTWRRSDDWEDGDTEAELALSFSEPVPEDGNRGSGIVRYSEVHRIRLTISHGL